jgi:hypothetical protein
MVRRIVAVVLALALNPALVRAQDTVFTVTVPSADVHSGPSIVTPVIGHASQSTVLSVSRDLGSWAKVPWPGAPDGVGYVHMTTGRLGTGKADAAAARVSTQPSSAVGFAASASAPAATTIPPASRKLPRERMAISGGPTDPPITHIVGVGGMVAPHNSFGVTARTWRTDHLGIQLAFARDAMTSDVAAGRVTSMRIEPGIVYGLFDHVSDYVWIRPYVGSVASFRRQTLKLSGPAAIERASDNGMGLRVFAGSELTFASLPRFGLSAELGYRRFQTTTFPEFEADRLSVSIAGHWYVK